MAAPTLVLQQLASALTSFTGSGTFTATRAFTQVTVAAGDQLAINIRTEDGWYHGTSVANAGTATVSAWTRVRTSGAVQTSCGNDLFTASVTAGGTLTPTVTMTSTNGVATARTGGTLVVATGATASASAVGTVRQLSYLTTSPASAVFTFTADWTAPASNGATFTPSTFGQVIDIRATDGVDQQTTAGANSSIFAAHWTDTGTAATTTFGLATPSAGTYTTTLLEFLGTSTAAVARPRRVGKRQW